MQGVVDGFVERFAVGRVGDFQFVAAGFRERGVEVEDRAGGTIETWSWGG